MGSGFDNEEGRSAAAFLKSILKLFPQVPTAIPVIVVIFALYLIIAPLVTNPQFEFVYGICLILATPLIYYPMVYRKYRLPGMDSITAFLQQTLDVSPTDWEDGLTNANHRD